MSVRIQMRTQATSKHALPALHHPQLDVTDTTEGLEDAAHGVPVLVRYDYRLQVGRLVRQGAGLGDAKMAVPCGATCCALLFVFFILPLNRPTTPTLAGQTGDAGGG